MIHISTADIFLHWVRITKKLYHL